MVILHSPHATAPPLPTLNHNTDANHYPNAHKLPFYQGEPSNHTPASSEPFIIDKKVLDGYRNNLAKLWNQIVTQWNDSHKPVALDKNATSFLHVAFRPLFSAQDLKTVQLFVESITHTSPYSTGVEFDFTFYDFSAQSIEAIQKILPAVFALSHRLKTHLCIRLSSPQLENLSSKHFETSSKQQDPRPLSQIFSHYFTYIRISLSDKRYTPEKVSDTPILNGSSSINQPENGNQSAYPDIPNFYLIRPSHNDPGSLLYCLKNKPPASAFNFHLDEKFTNHAREDDPPQTPLRQTYDALGLPRSTPNTPHVQLNVVSTNGSSTNEANNHHFSGFSHQINRSPNINQIRNRYNTVQRFANIPVSRSETGLSGLHLPSRSPSPSHFYSLYSNKSDLTLHKVTAIQTALEDNKAPTYLEARDPLRRINTPKPKLRAPDPTDQKQLPTPRSLENLGWTILVCTWVTVIGGIGSMFGVWKSLLGFDSSAVRYSLSYEKETGYPISEYYACLFFMIFIVSWVWCIISWMGMKFYRHTKGGITSTRNE